MNEFKREKRYYVFKARDVERGIELYPIEEKQIRDALILLDRVTRGARIVDKKKYFECVCIESDWDCYEAAWHLVKQEWNRRTDSQKEGI